MLFSSDHIQRNRVLCNIKAAHQKPVGRWLPGDVSFSPLSRLRPKSPGVLVQAVIKVMRVSIP